MVEPFSVSPFDFHFPFPKENPGFDIMPVIRINIKLSTIIGTIAKKACLMEKAAAVMPASDGPIKQPIS